MRSILAMKQPSNLSEILSIFVRDYVALEPKARVVLISALNHPIEVAFGTALSLAKHCGVSASVVSRLAKAFGFRKFADFRKLFKDAVRPILKMQPQVLYLHQKEGKAEAEADSSRDS